MPQNQLKSSLDSVIEECVSFVGVDINTCSECLLRSVKSSSRLDRWMTCYFTFFSTVFKSYQDNVWMIMKGCVQWNPV